MGTQTETKPKVDAPAQWPPIAHLVEDRAPGTAVEGDRALCGAEIMGINLDDAHEVCEECVRIHEEMTT